MKKTIRNVAIALVLILLLFVSGIYIYSLDYYHADSEAINTSLSADYEKQNKYLIYEPSDQNFTESQNNTGIIFYPGGKVSYEAYSPLSKALSQKGFTCILLHMPLNLAVFDINAADKVYNMYPDIDNWYIAGHSLGGAMGASYIAKNFQKYKGLILLGAYSTENLCDTPLSVLSIYGSEDHVLNKDKYNEYKTNLPESTKEVIIKGGCHSYFGNYGLQDGDGTPDITRTEQIQETVDSIYKWINEED